MSVLPTFTKVWHNASYPSISPTRPELSAANKTIFITGGGTGVGRSIAQAFAAAGAADIVITARTLEPMEETKAIIESTSRTKVHIHVADITDSTAINYAFTSTYSTLGSIHVLVNNAAFMPGPGNFKDSSMDDWWKGFEVNVKGGFAVVQAFLKVAARNPVIVNISTLVSYFGTMPTFSGYAASKLAFVRALEFLAEEEGVKAISVQPGVFLTAMGKKGGDDSLPYDDLNLPGHFILWLTSDEADFLKGRFVWANWDVDELMARREEILSENKLKITLAGWP